jgi:hypothetical protein
LGILAQIWEFLAQIWEFLAQNWEFYLKFGLIGPNSKFKLNSSLRWSYFNIFFKKSCISGPKDSTQVEVFCLKLGFLAKIRFFSPKLSFFILN